MPSYRCYFLDSGDHVAASELIDCETDGQAQANADRLLATCNHPTVEVWNLGRRVYCAQKTPPFSNDGQA